MSTGGPRVVVFGRAGVANPMNTALTNSMKGNVMRMLLAFFFATALATAPALAQQDAEALVASKRSADMSYRELMQILGRALGWMQDGVILQNKQLMREGANAILNHPAPNHKPWTIMAAPDQEGFKQALPTYDKVLDASASEVVKAAEKGDWMGAMDATGRLQGACVSCHLQWKQKARP